MSSTDTQNPAPRGASISLHNLSILRAAVEGRPLESYFGSTGALQFWIDSTVALGLVNAQHEPTPLGESISRRIGLTSQPSGRATLWRDALEIEKRAGALLDDAAGVPWTSTEPRRCWACGALPDVERPGSFWRLVCTGKGSHSASPIAAHTMKTKRAATEQWNQLGTDSVAAQRG